MLYAIEEAKKALQYNEIPVGAIIVKDDKIIAKTHNMKEQDNDPTAHAEIVAIRQACKELNTWRLKGCDMYVTLEPCPMCAGAIINSRIKNLYIGTSDPKAGACGSIMNIVEHEALNHKVNVYHLENDECSKILKDFFKLKRK